MVVCFTEKFNTIRFGQLPEALQDIGTIRLQLFKENARQGKGQTKTPA